MRISIIISALIAVLVGFGGSVAIVIAAADAVAATQAQTASWIAVLCLSMMVTTAILSLKHRMPIITAWSTPGAALIATTSGLTINQAVGAFLFCGALLLFTAAFKPLGALVSRIPPGIAAAILAGVLLPFVLNLVSGVQTAPWLGLPLVVVFLVLRLVSPTWAVLAVLGLGLGLSYGLDMTTPVIGIGRTRLVWVAPEFDLAALIGLGLPLYLVTMASQNLPGIAVLRAAGYAPPGRSVVAVTGAASLITAFFGAHTTSLAAITASICTGPDTHPDKDKRWLCGPVYALGYGGLALFATYMVALIASVPPQLVAIVAGTALLGPFMASARLVFATKADPLPAVAAFVVTASGFGAFGIGSAFWGLMAGIGIGALGRLRPTVE